jgi:plastocyanin
VTLLLLPATLLAGCGTTAPGMDPGSAADAGAAQPPPTAAALPSAAAEAARAAPQAVVNQVAIDNFAFRPATLTIAVGTKVTWVNRDDVPHTATSTKKPRLFDSGTLDTDERFTHVFTAPGTYEYFCALHPHMTGKIVVK